MRNTTAFTMALFVLGLTLIITSLWGCSPDAEPDHPSCVAEGWPDQRHGEMFLHVACDESFWAPFLSAEVSVTNGRGTRLRTISVNVTNPPNQGPCLDGRIELSGSNPPPFTGSAVFTMRNNDWGYTNRAVSFPIAIRIDPVPSTVNCLGRM